MNTSSAIFLVLGFLAVFMMLEGLYQLWNDPKTVTVKRVRERLYLLAAADKEQLLPSISRERRLSSNVQLNALLAKLPKVNGFDTLLLQAGSEHSVAELLVGMGAGFLVGVALGVLMNLGPALLLVLGLAIAMVPVGWLRLQRARRTKAIVSQLPDALDLICRALKAGHALSATLSMVAGQSPQPIAGEFKTTFDEINFGVSTKKALLNLAARVPAPDVRFFVLAVSIQLETGGNLATLLGILAALIRERFKFFGKVRVLAAEGKLSAYILTGLPLALGGMIQLVNPSYIGLLFSDPIGIMVVQAALAMMVIGVFLLWRINNVRL